jgi:hypothetical protein
MDRFGSELHLQVMPDADSFNALQVTIRALHFDRPTTVSMFGYVIGIAQRNADGAGQLYLSQGSFKVRRDGNAATRDDRVKRWEGDGELVFSTKLDGLDQVGLDLYFVRDNRRVRGFGKVLEEALGGDNQTVNTAIEIISGALPAAGVGGALVALAPGVLRGFGKLLRRAPNRMKVRAEGTLRLSTLRQRAEDPEFDGELKWGVDHSDKGYFVTDWDLVTMANPDVVVVHPQIPSELTERIAMM